VDEAEDIFLKAEKDLSRLRQTNERLKKKIRENHRDKEVLRRRTNALAYRAMEQGECVAPIQVSKASRCTSQDDG
jgi:predicted RNase H-like nuclease (RuvC/YqgF family)